MSTVTNVNNTSFTNYTSAAPEQNGNLYGEYEQLLQILEQIQQDIADQNLSALESDYAKFTSIANSATALNQYCHEYLASLEGDIQWAVSAAQNGNWGSANAYFNDAESVLQASPPGLFDYFIQQMEAFQKEYPGGFTAQQFLAFINANTGPGGYSLISLLEDAIIYLNNRGDAADAQVFQNILNFINNTPPNNAESLNLFIEFLEQEFQQL